MKGLAAGLFEPRDILDVFQPLQHLLILFDGEDDRDGFAAAGDYLWFFGQRTHERSITDSGRGVNLCSTFGKFQWGYGWCCEGEDCSTQGQPDNRGTDTLIPSGWAAWLDLDRLRGVFREPDGTTASGWNDVEVDWSECCLTRFPGDSHLRMVN